MAASQTFGLGNSWSIGSGSNSTISKVTTTFNPGTPPPTQEGELYLWSGLSAGTGDLLKASIESWGDQSWCGGDSSQWCIRTSVFSKQENHDGNYADLDANQPVTLTYERNADKSGWTISAAVGGQTVSTLQFDSGPMTMFGISTECDDYCNGSVSPQTYTNTIIELEDTDAEWGTTAVAGDGVTGDGTADFSGMSATSAKGPASRESGKVWSISQITIPKM